MADVPEFRPGDRVRLNTGGPEMSVQSVIDGPQEQEIVPWDEPRPRLVVCQWFVGDSLQAGKFVPESLVRASP